MTLLIALSIQLSAFGPAADLGVSASRRFDVPDAWLDRTRFLESTHRNYVVGKAGERGPYQIQRNIWEHYSTLPWRCSAHDPVASRRVARLILKDCMNACRRDGRPVTFKNVRWYYRHGGF
jgi:hypothetical protein